MPSELSFPWEREAMQNEPMPAGLTAAGQSAYQAMAYLYSRYKIKAVEREEASREKKMIKKQYEQQAKIEEKVKSEWKRFADRTLNTEAAITTYRKADNDADRITAANRLIEILDGIRV